jgi:hypothetical protein
MERELQIARVVVRRLETEVAKTEVMVSRLEQCTDVQAW